MIAHVFQKNPENFAFQLCIILQQFTREFVIFLKSSLLFNSFYCLSFLLINKTLRLNNFKTRTAINAKISVFVTYVEAIIDFLLYNLHNCTFNKLQFSEWKNATLSHVDFHINKYFQEYFPTSKMQTDFK